MKEVKLESLVPMTLPNWRTDTFTLKLWRSQYLQVIVEPVVLVLPASLNDDACAEDQRHQEDSVPQLLQVLLQHTQEMNLELHSHRRWRKHTATVISK